MLPRQRVGTYQENEFTRNWSENAGPQSSQLAKPLRTDSGLKSGVGARELISTLINSAGWNWFIEPFLQIHAYEEKATRHQK